MEAVIFKVSTRSEKFIKLIELLQERGLKVVVESREEGGEDYNEIIVYQGSELETD